MEDLSDLCPLGGDVTNDCSGCVDSGEFCYDYETKTCRVRPELRGEIYA